ncbi:hypothetical protein FIBSPDRAFT_1046363 [Athelia psychrophila]|uniref:Uncharacterized protein n=1 Tax=Athelia psychrophila TaxID=1759441 RepID=A0A166GSW5_9AGAM|nr:hypothetical protein FIBSPDRAFT_1046363 [Fibularhizoctonia sp. CBS 109695]
MSLFHVYIRSAAHGYTMTVAFASHEVADEWWRAMSTHTETSNWIKRVSPQLYLSTGPNPRSASQPGALYYPRKDGTSQFDDKMVYLWQSDSYTTNSRDLASQFGGSGTRHGTLGIIPAQSTTNQTSGNSFFIRSKVEPYDYWYCPTTAGRITEGTKVYTSREERTRFRVRIADEKMQPGAIMIGADEITISPAFAPALRVSVENGVARAGLAAAGSESEHPKLKLSDVRTGFTSGGRVTDDENDFDIVVRELVEALDGDGEGWELV